MAKRWIIGVALCLSAVATGATPAGATPGEADSTFSGDGHVSSDAAPGLAEAAEDVVVQDDGKVVVAGWVGGLRQPGSKMLVARYTVDGDLDPTFSGDGVVQFAFPGVGGENAYAVDLDSTGRIVVAGSANGRFGVARLTVDGELDPTFGDAGRATLAGTGPNGWAADVVVDAADRVVAVGRLAKPRPPGDDRRRPDAAMVIARLTAAGQPDPSFNGDGLSVIDKSPFVDTLEAVDIDGTGHIVAGGRLGSRLDLGGTSTVLVRFGPGGRRDPSFGNRGFAGTPLGYDAQHLHGLAVDSLGRILVAGQGGGRIVLVRVDDTGEWDRSFDGDGIRHLDLRPGAESADAIQEDSFGNIVVAGTMGIGGNQRAFVLRLRQSGRSDRSFGADGVVPVDLGTGPDRGTGLAIDPDGRLVLSATGPGVIAAARLLRS